MSEQTDSHDVLDPTGSLARLSNILASAETLESVLADMVELAAERIPGADQVSLTLIDDGRPTTIASTGELATEMDERQYEVGWGPCLDSIGAASMSVVDDVATETRWPKYLERARELGVASSLSAPLPAQQHLGGAFNIYSLKPHVFGAASRELAQSFADHGALALAQAYRYTSTANQAETLREAMRSRAVIEQAKGIFMAAREVDADTAFDMLVRLSQTRHVKLRELAAQIVTQASGHPADLETD